MRRGAGAGAGGDWWDEGRRAARGVVEKGKRRTEWILGMRMSLIRSYVYV